MSFLNSPVGYSEFTGENEYIIESSCLDTLPDKEGIKMKDFDQLQAQLDKVLGKAGAELKGIDFEKLQIDAATQALKEIDMDKIMKSVEQSLKSIDLDKTLADISVSLKDLKIDYKKEEVEKALAEAKKEIEKGKIEIKNIDKDAIKKEIDKSRLEIEKIDLNKIMDEARSGIDKAKDELKLTKEMFTEMEKDGLVNSKEGFTVEYKNRVLYIDGRKQDEKTTDKYRKYFKQDHFKITIEKE
jgi:DNA-directed RNA polymerase subunit K/omega